MLSNFPIKTQFTALCKLKNLDVNDHQLKGIDWVVDREREPDLGSPGGFLCDEMGLGKTILMIGAMVLNAKKHTLIVLPKSLIHQWYEAITKFSHLDAQHILIYHGSAIKSKVPISEYAVVITTYGMISTRKPTQKVADYKCPLWAQSWDRIIYDESHHLRNHKNSKFEGAKFLRAPIKWMVTGTPINNKKRDFYNQSVIQGSSNTFTSSMKELRKIIDSIVLKRTKKEVGIKMPHLNEEVIEVAWKSPKEEAFVRNVHNLMNFATVTEANVNMIIHNLGSMYRSALPLFILMRQACVKPSMAYDSLSRRALENSFDLGEFDEPKTSSKMMAVIGKVVENEKSGKSKIIFCQFRKEMDYLYMELQSKGFNPSIINGSTSKKQRRYALQAGLKDDEWKEVAPKFPKDVCNIINEYISPNVLIAQIQTSCEGLNLQHFAEVYFTTPTWNPAVESQAIARCHRIGQTKAVDIYRFITSFKGEGQNKSLDEYCMEVQGVKKEMIDKYGL
jgi:SNF2 family DNA or RNA helicase